MLNQKEFQTVLITGASSGIGRALAHELAPLSSKLILVARRLPELQALQKELSSLCPTELVVCDLLNEGQRRDLAARYAGQVDVLVNNAGLGRFGSFLSQSDSQLRDSLHLNCLVLTELCRDFGRGMAAKKGGRIVNIASLAGFLSTPYFSVYAATKAYVTSLSEALDVELAPSGIRVLCVAPGGISTGFHRTAGLPDTIVEKYRSAMMTPEELARQSVRALRKGKSLTIPGAANQLTYLLSLLLPRRFVTVLAKRFYEPFLAPEDR
jgi:hypothetical protein